MVLNADPDVFISLSAIAEREKKGIFGKLQASPKLNKTVRFPSREFMVR